MSTFNLPETYARVCAKRPELAVEGLERYGTHDMPVDVWLLFGALAEDSTAAALILARWVEALPTGHWITHTNQDFDTTMRPDGWRVGRHTSSGYTIAPIAPTPIEALAAFWLEYQA